MSNETKEELPHTNDIEGIYTWPQKAVYPIIEAGDLGESAKDGTLNGNWLRIRNYLQDLYDLVNSKIGVGVVNTWSAIQTFANGIVVGGSGTAGMVKFYSPSGVNTLILKTGTITSDRILTMPDVSAQIATTIDRDETNQLITVHKTLEGGADHLEYNNTRYVSLDKLGNGLTHDNGNEVSVTTGNGIFYDDNSAIAANADEVTITTSIGAVLSILNGGVTSEKLAKASITGDKIANGAICQALLGADVTSFNDSRYAPMSRQNTIAISFVLDPELPLIPVHMPSPAGTIIKFMTISNGVVCSVAISIPINDGTRLSISTDAGVSGLSVNGITVAQTSAIQADPSSALVIIQI